MDGIAKHTDYLMIASARQLGRGKYVLNFGTSKKVYAPIFFTSRKTVWTTLKSIERHMRKRNISGTIKCLIAGLQSVRRIRDSITTYERTFMPDGSVCPVINRRPKNADYPRYTPDEMQIIDNPHLDRVEYHYYNFLHRMHVDIRNEPERAEDARRLAEHFASLEADGAFG